MTAKIIGKKVMISNLAVIEGERLVDEIVFEMPIAYGQTDLTDKEAHVNLRRADGSTDKIVVPFVVDGETIFVTWKLDATATAVPGELDVHLSFESLEGDVIYMTERFTLNIQPSVDAYRDLTDRSPTALSKLQRQMAEYVMRMQELVDEVNEKISGIEGGGTGSGGGSGGGAVYDEANKLPADYVDGLAAVAKSGSYGDLIDAPFLALYATQAELASKGDEIKNTFSPIYVKYITNSNTFAEIIDWSNYNKAVLTEWKGGANLSRPVFLWDTATNTYYPTYYVVLSEDQADIFFLKDNALYSVFYNSANDSFGFNV